MSRRRFVEDIALQRIRLLFEMAHEVVRRDRDLARRYVELALRISKRARVRVPRELKRRYCKRCLAYLVPGLNARVRLRNNRMPHVVITCLECGYVRRIPYASSRASLAKSSGPSS